MVGAAAELRAVEPAETIGRRIQRAREASGLSLDELHVKTGLAASTISRIENGRARPGYVTLEKLTEVLGDLGLPVATPGPQPEEEGAEAVPLQDIYLTVPREFRAEFLHQITAFALELRKRKGAQEPKAPEDD